MINTCPAKHADSGIDDVRTCLEEFILQTDLLDLLVKKTTKHMCVHIVGNFGNNPSEDIWVFF